MSLKEKGQISFEILLLTTVVFSAAIWVSSYYLSIKDPTLAMQLTKIHTLKQIEASSGSYIIQKIDFEEQSGAITLKINTIGEPTFQCTEMDADDLKVVIAKSTKYSPVDKVIINLNGTNCPTA